MTSITLTGTPPQLLRAILTLWLQLGLRVLLSKSLHRRSILLQGTRKTGFSLMNLTSTSSCHVRTSIPVIHWSGGLAGKHNSPMSIDLHVISLQSLVRNHWSFSFFSNLTAQVLLLLLRESFPVAVIQFPYDEQASSLPPSVFWCFSSSNYALNAPRFLNLSQLNYNHCV